MKLSVVIPAYNEERDIEVAIWDVVEHFPDAEIIVVNDASTDKTLTILTFLQKSIPNLIVLTNIENRGHGYSVVKGLKEATGDYILYIDADRQISLDNFIEFGADIVSGRRINRQDKLFRKIISFGLKTTILFRHQMYFKDANCPFKIYKRETIQPLLYNLPKTYIVPIACLQVLAKRKGLGIITVMTPHLPYKGTRKGFLQILDLSVVRFFTKAFLEVVKL